MHAGPIISNAPNVTVSLREESRPAEPPHQRRRGQAADEGSRVGRQERQPRPEREVRQLEIPDCHEVEGYEEVECVPGGLGQKPRYRYRPEIAGGDDFTPTGGLCKDAGIVPIEVDVPRLGLRQPRVLLGAAVEQVPGECEEEAEAAGNQEGRLPAEI
jgi:hypothetical protein